MEKECQSRRSRNTVKSAPALAIRGVDATETVRTSLRFAETDPCKVLFEWVGSEWTFKRHEVIFQDDRGKYVEGDVLVVRNPCNAPWDVQKFRAVGLEELHNRFADIGCVSGPPYLQGGMVIFSTHASCGRHAPADLLAGGDYDGDAGLVIAYEKLVHNFKPTDKDSAIEKNLEKIAEALVSRGAGKDVAAQAAVEIECGELVSQLTTLWWRLADAFGVGDPDAVRAAVAAQLAIDKKLPAGDWVKLQNREAKVECGFVCITCSLLNGLFAKLVSDFEVANPLHTYVHT